MGNGSAPSVDAGTEPATNEPSDVAGGTSGTAGGGPAPVQLRSAGNYAILAQSAITNVPTSAITGDVGISPAAASSITGLVLTLAGIKSAAPEVDGDIFAADGQAPTPSALSTAVSDMHAAYDDAAGRISPEFLNLGAGAIGGLTLTSGLYKWTSVVTIATDVTISGDANDVWIFQIAG
ncbi:MAG: ice-binding family protein, partial [Deltaproteobacteria bacterium]